ncbi:extracellular solute-binding protein [Streptomyces sp. B3I8]|uniref:extracellular solute-binding protein n=1 Tax=Streptomyces sp. B3I8 TaxID=3042303 RepID=UPI002784B4DC|nr:extracellular solute-binding protein [Streptomyces sp. B3I8]MDQ0791144.1 putative spermidine/putrescine transport system substrate-binding protein [Streptomyces sp. B3I8]
MASKRVLGILSTLVCASLLAACAGGESEGSGKKGDGKLTFVAYGGDGQKTMEEAWQKPYMKKNPGVSFVNTSPTDVAQVKAQVQSGQVKWDVIATSPAAAEQNCGTLFEPLEITGVKRSELVEQSIGKCYTGNFINATPIAYRTKAFPDPAKAPKTVADFFDTKKFPGKRGLVNNLQNGILEYPLLADGVSPGNLYPLDVDRSLKKLDTIRDQTTFAPNVGALQQAVGAGQVDIFALPDSRITPLLQDGVDITVVWDVTVTSINGFAVPKGSPEKKNAEKFMAWVLGPEASANISQALGTAPINKAAKPNLSKEAKQVEVYGPANTGKTVLQDIDWYAKNFNDVTTKLQNWLAG